MSQQTASSPPKGWMQARRSNLPVLKELLTLVPPAERTAAVRGRRSRTIVRHRPRRSEMEGKEPEQLPQIVEPESTKTNCQTLSNSNLGGLRTKRTLSIIMCARLILVGGGGGQTRTGMYGGDSPKAKLNFSANLTPALKRTASLPSYHNQSHDRKGLGLPRRGGQQDLDYTNCAFRNHLGGGRGTAPQVCVQLPAFLRHLSRS